MLTQFQPSPPPAPPTPPAGRLSSTQVTLTPTIQDLTDAFGNPIVDVNGVPVAAVSLDNGSTVYDPFKSTSQAVSLLKLRRKQVLAAA